MEFRLLGPNVNKVHGGMVEEVIAWRPPVALILDNVPEWAWLNDNSPETVVIGREYHEQEPDFNDPNINPEAEAKAFVARDLKMILRTNYDYYQGTNESVVRSREAMSRFARFEVERARLMKMHYNRSVAVGSFAVGNPHDLSYWREFIPALEAAKKYGGILALHQYNWPTLRDNDNEEAAWTTLRHRKVYNGEPSHDWEGLPDHLKTTPLVITECGVDGLVVDTQPKGWRLSGLSLMQYADELHWFDQELQKDKYVFGAAIYVYGNLSWEWWSYDIRPDLSRYIIDNANPLYRPIVSPPIDPTFPLGIDVSVHQGRIKWRQVALDGVKFAMIRASQGLKFDGTFERNWKNASRWGIAVMPYHFQTHYDDPWEQGLVFANALGHRRMTVAWDDLETYAGGGPSPRDQMLFAAAFNDNAASNVWGAPELGYYSSAHMMNKLGFNKWPSDAAGSGTPALAWLADWNKTRYGNPRRPKGCKEWEYQQTTSRGRVKGINGRVDLDIFNGSLSELHDKYRF